jgi:dimethylhistidine N-methyltransferase
MVQQVNVGISYISPSPPTTKTIQAIEEILIGMRKRHKELPTKYLYDSTGSQLFESICELEEYYPTRVETGILNQNIDEIARLIKPDPVIIELGSGSSTKTRILLDHLQNVSAYLPVDISFEHLQQSADALRQDYPGLTILPITSDFTKRIHLPALAGPGKNNLVFFPGSTIGNFYPDEVPPFLNRIGQAAGRGSGLLIGVDLVNDIRVLHSAYNDSKGVTAAFNLNLLNHVNKTVGADFNSGRFRHCAFFDQDESRIEMHLVSTIHQTVHIDGHKFTIRKDESILTEVSYKYTPDRFSSLANKAGYKVRKTWLDPQAFFSVQYLERE